ncbi:MAG: isocitrate/isopropylmalate family dehydrogenase [Gammaproteobacteria bacterium]|nr:isocitrate/isopropylmalate family dehydrogenase [Gammaproteobacteria bacterium]
MINKQVVVIEGEDSSPEAMGPAVNLLRAMELPIDFIFPPVGEPAREEFGTTFPDPAREAIDASDATFFGSTSGPSSAALFYLRWGKQTYANVRPCKYLPGYRSSLAHPEGVDFIILRENLEDLYIGVEGEIEDLAGLNLTSRTARTSLASMAPGKFAIKAITEKGSQRIIRYAFELARERDGMKKVTVACKYNMLSTSDGFFREIGNRIAGEYPDVEHETYIIDDFCYRMNSNPHQFDVCVMPNLYGDILSDGAAGLIGGLGLAPSGCYGDDYAYFESAHGTAPDITGQNIINPTATLLSASMMLDYLGMDDAGRRLHDAVAAIYAKGDVLTPDQGGTASTTEFCEAVQTAL